MHELSSELGRFISGAIDLDQLRALFRAYLSRHPDERDSISRWLRNTVEEGRLSATVWLTLRDLFEPPAATLEAARRADVSKATVLARGQAPAPTSTELAARQPHRRRTTDRAEPPLFDESPAVSCDTLVPHMVVKDRFVLVEKLGSGGMGQVFKALDRRREEAHDRHPFIALKVLNKEVSAHPDSFMALQREARRASTLAHPNVVTVYDFDRDGSRIYMTMEYLEGRGLDDFIDERCAEGGLPLAEVLPIIRGVGMALEYGHHKRIVHCDLKPGNIFICKDGTVKVLDFGIARLIRPTDTKSDQTIFDPALVLHGLTPAYASLEMWKQADPDPRDDIYALACVTYELLSGRHPFDRQSAKLANERELSPKRIDSLTRTQWEGLKQGLALKREDRTPSISAFLKPFAPQSRVKKYAIPGAIAGLLVTVGALGLSARYYRVAVEDSTLQLLQCAQIPKPSVISSALSGSPPTTEQQQEIDDYIALARDYLLDATPATRIEDLKYILSDGPNSVTDILNTVLRIHPAQREALQLQAEVANVYATRARALTGEHRVSEALDLVRYSRQTLPSSQELFKLEQSICRMEATAQN
ncbi:serine/threonine-protein kinase [Steroidobacter sp.]|uniref:serine/threonine-protein kinase n=1 Tax=Steroidobacter sp. TaxID=1978227 RepID=UPI001A5FA9AB|nr:serine/threonine-protein kinase [Steroidobacter sp.]MBL8267721.1 serine/threonine protein kinase [Steroidobacter sp.]